MYALLNWEYKSLFIEGTIFDCKDDTLSLPNPAQTLGLRSLDVIMKELA